MKNLLLQQLMKKNQKVKMVAMRVIGILDQHLHHHQDEENIVVIDDIVVVTVVVVHHHHQVHVLLIQVHHPIVLVHHQVVHIEDVDVDDHVRFPFYYFLHL
jgi:hypothetical protein